MERIKNYAKIIQEIIESHSINHAEDDTEVITIFDDKRHHYQLLHLGWDELRRVFACVIHIDIKDDKIWIQKDGTETGIANELMNHGISQKDIVLGFHAPYKRKFTEFADS